MKFRQEFFLTRNEEKTNLKEKKEIKNNKGNNKNVKFYVLKRTRDKFLLLNNSALQYLRLCNERKRLYHSNLLKNAANLTNSFKFFLLICLQNKQTLKLQTKKKEIKRNKRNNKNVKFNVLKRTRHK